MRGRRHKLQVSTFPFLAVLLCAMGSLILILLVMDRKAHRAALMRAQREAAKLVEDNARKNAEREHLRQQTLAEQEKKRETLHANLTNEQLEMQLQMRKVREQLQEIAARLHYEQDTSTELRRKVQNERSRLQADEQLLATLRSNADRAENQATESNKTLRRMTIDLLRMEQALKDLQAAQRLEQKTFSVVPYHGRRGENRRPIYVECSGEGVVFHPEHKAMPVSALLPGARDPSNDVRAEVQQRIARQRAKLAGLPGNKNDTPYLLLLLRPAGVNTYHLFQAALRGLDLDFGYEFIDDDWVLDFPADDEMPSAQPWMIASKTSARSVPVAVAPSSTRPIARPIAAPVSGAPGGSFASNVRTFRSNEATGFAAALGQNPAANATGSGPSGAGGGSGGAGGGNGGTGTTGGGTGATGSLFPSTGALAGKRGGFVGGGNGLGDGTGGSGEPGVVGSSSSTGSGMSSSSTNSFAPTGGGASNALGLFPGGGGGASGRSTLLPSSSGGGSGSGDGSGSEGTGIGMGTGGVQRHGHPSAMPPSSVNSQGQDGPAAEGAPIGGDFRALGGPYIPGGTGYGTGSSNGSSSGGGGSDPPGLGPPRAWSSGSPGGAGMSGNGVAGTGSPGGNGVSGSGSPGSGMVGGNGLAGTGAPGGTGVSGNGVTGNGPPGGGGMGGNGVAGSGSPGGNGVAGSGSPGGNGVAGSGSPGSGNSGGGTAGGGSSGVGDPNASPAGNPAGGQTVIASANSGGNGTSQGSGSGGSTSSGAGTGASTTPTSGGSPPGSSGNSGNGSASSPGGGAAASGAGSSDTFIYIDPVTGKPMSPPPAATPSSNAAPQAPSAAEPPGNSGPPRVHVVAGNGGGSGEPADSQSQELNRFAPTPTTAAPPRRPIVTRPAWVHGGRDWTIYLECQNEGVVLYPSQRIFSLAESTRTPAGNPLIKAIQQMIDRRQSARRPDEPPYHPHLCILVRPEHIRTFLTLYPALEALPLPKSRRNLDADDDVIGIVTGSIP
jgi:hypothetical protein